MELVVLRLGVLLRSAGQSGIPVKLLFLRHVLGHHVIVGAGHQGIGVIIAAASVLSTSKELVAHYQVQYHRQDELLLLE